MPAPYVRSQAELSAGAGKKRGGGSVLSKGVQHATNTAKQSVRVGRQNNAAYLKQLQDLIYGSGDMGGFDTGGGGGSGGGGGGGGGFSSGPSAYEKWQIEQEKRRQAELDRRKLELTQGLQGARRQAIPLLNQYATQYGKDINTTFGNSRKLDAGYGKQLSALAGQMNTQMTGQQNMLRNDLRAQGGGAGDLRAMEAAAQQGMAGNNFLNLNSQMLNQRLAQAMAASQADATNMGSAIKASSLGNLENSYAQLLAQIGMIGLQ